MWAFTAQARDLKAEVNLNRSQISVKYLINFTTNCFVRAATVVSARTILLRNLQNSSISVPFGQLNSILHRPAYSKQNSVRAKLQNPSNLFMLSDIMQYVCM